MIINLKNKITSGKAKCFSSLKRSFKSSHFKICVVGTYLKTQKAHSRTIVFYELMYLKEDTISHITQLKSNSLQLYV